MLNIKNVTVNFGTKNVLKNLSCTVNGGDFIVIVGANGAGKSTFFDLISGKVAPASGHVIIDGTDVTSYSETQRASMVTRLFQNPHLNSVGSMTVAQNLAMAHYGRRTVGLVNGMSGCNAQQIEALLKPLDTDTTFIVQQRMNSLSGGQQQLIAFIMSTLDIPKLLLLDEPTAALDPQAATKLLTLAYQFTHTHKVTTLLITHDPLIALSIGNKIWVLEDGIITKQFNEADKKNLHAQDLIGHIDYAAIKNGML
ncbi:MAG: ATP-binding cassette domain-containing protein [Candidatus Dependentiae bacterium]|nr:ATP-binding cassette domain-containing protein [Candidatus Dependentiae bacterium]